MEYLIPDEILNQKFRKKLSIKTKNYRWTETQTKNNKYKIILKERVTKQELIFKDFLDKNKIKFIFQKGFLSPFHRIVDFYIKKYRLIVEIDGGYHLGCKDKDEYKDKIWGELHFKTLRILNTDVDNGNYKEIFNNFIALQNLEK